MRRRHLVPVILLALAAGLFAGCGNDDAAAERTAEEILEAGSGEDVDVDVDGEDVTIEGKDGSSSFSTSDELPEGWPDDIAMPDGAKLQGSSAIAAGEGRNLTTSGTVDLSVRDVVTHFEGEFEEWKTEGTADIGTGDDAVSNRSWSRDGDQATLTATRSGDSGDVTFVVAITTETE